MFEKYSRTAVCKLASNVYKTMKQVGNALKESEDFLLNNLTAACCLNVYHCKMTMNKKLQ